MRLCWSIRSKKVHYSLFILCYFRLLTRFLDFIEMLADTIKQALDMQYQERKLRMNALQTRERLFNLDTWLESFFEACDLIDSLNKMQSLNTSDYETWLGPIIKGYKLTIIIDYDGTLVPIAPHPDLAVLPDDIKVDLIIDYNINILEIHFYLIYEGTIDKTNRMSRDKYLHPLRSTTKRFEEANTYREYKPSWKSRNGTQVR